MPNNTTISILVRMRYGLLALSSAMLFGLSACGESDSPSTEPGAEQADNARVTVADPASAEPRNEKPAPSRVVNSLSFEAKGDVDGALESDGTDLMLTGGCLDRNVIGMSFTRGQITDKDLFQVRIRTGDSVAAGETGTFPVSELGWYDGQFEPDDLPTNLSVLVPDSYEGSGTLSITLHEAGGLNGRLVGTVEGTVKQSSGDNEAMIRASFDINLGCTYFSLN